MQTCRYVFDNDREEKEKLQREHDKAVRNRDRLANEMAYNLTASKFLANISNATERRQKWKEFIEKRVRKLRSNLETSSSSVSK